MPHSEMWTFDQKLWCPAQVFTTDLHAPWCCQTPSLPGLISCGCGLLWLCTKPHVDIPEDQALCKHTRSYQMAGQQSMGPQGRWRGRLQAEKHQSEGQATEFIGLLRLFVLSWKFLKLKSSRLLNIKMKTIFSIQIAAHLRQKGAEEEEDKLLHSVFQILLS